MGQVTSGRQCYFNFEMYFTCGQFDFSFDCLEYLSLHFDFNMARISIVSISIVETIFLAIFIYILMSNKLLVAILCL